MELTPDEIAIFASNEEEENGESCDESSDESADELVAESDVKVGESVNEEESIVSIPEVVEQP